MSIKLKMMVMIIAAGFLLSASAFADSERMQNAANGHWYQRFDTSKTWIQAKSFCKSLGGKLASVTSSSENNIVYGSLCSTSTQWCWLGGTDVQNEGVWTWVSGQAFNYANFDGGEPNDCNGEHYLMYFTPPDERAGFWNDLGQGLSAQGVSGGCGCGGCADEWYPMSTVCEWDRQPSRVMGLLNWWTANGNAGDAVGGKDGNLMGGATYTTGLSGQAFDLNGVDSYVSVVDRSNLNFGDQDFSVAVWVNFNTIDGEQILVEKYVENFNISEGWTLTKVEDQNAIVFSGGPAEPYDLPNYIFAVPPMIAPGVWNLVVAARTGTTATIYWNGSAIGTESIRINPNSASSLKIGHRGNPTDTPGSADDRGFYLNGKVDEVMIFNHALTADEVANLYTRRDTNSMPY